MASSGVLTVTTNQSQWTAKSNQSWLTVSPASGKSGAQATLKVTANTALASRTGTVTFSAGGKTATVTVTQAAASSSAATLSLSGNLWKPTAVASLGVLTVTTNQSQWTAKSDQSWLTVSPASGKNGDQALLRVTANTSTTSRSGTVTFSAGGKTSTVTVVQAGKVSTQ
ncbi:MAG: BACON domain-containing protein [Azoarcus sp.]|nr:BACON domain-containing protein [Azoarcus sp.]